MALTAARIHDFLNKKIWQVRAEELPFPRSLLLKALKILLLSLRGFKEDQSAIRASALTLYTLLAIVPVTALLFGIAKGFGLETRLEGWLLQQFPEQQEVMQRTVLFARRTLETAEGGLVAGAGVAFLLYAVLKVIGNIEQAFNHIWSITKSRPWSRKFSDYLSLLLVGPFLILGASSLNVLLATFLHRAAEVSPLSSVLSPLTQLMLRAIPFILLWVLFSFLFSFLPNTKVRLLSALVGGGVSALLYQVAQSFYIDVQIGVTRTNAVYGSFAALPLFILWLQISWHIVLIGAEITHQHQNFASNEREEHAPALSFRAIKRLGLEVTSHVAGAFLRGEPAPTADILGKDLGIPSRVLSDILRRLECAGILSEVAGGDPEDPGYQPARDPHLLTPVGLLEALEKEGEDLAESGTTEGREARVWKDLLARLEEAARRHPGNIPFGTPPGPRRE